MQRILNPFVLVVSAILLAGYVYLAWRLTSSAPERLALAAPVLMAWSIPVVYWAGGRERTGTIDELVHGLGYLSVAWLNFVMVLTVARDVLLLVTSALPPLAGARAALHDAGVGWIFLGALAALGVGALAVLRGPRIRRVDVPIEGLHDELEGFRIVQISDLHVGPTIRAAYVRRVVEMTRELTPDLIALTGDIVDGSVQRLADHVAPLAELGRTGRAFLVLGNHDYYAGATVWTARFEAMGLRVLRNSHVVVEHGVARLVVGGVIDFAARHGDPDARPRPDLAADGAAGAAVRLLLAHNPKIAPAAERAGFDLQLSGHTHGGQFFPWTLAIHLIHGPHAAGLSRRGRMWVYVSAGTGTWGPPVRFGTTPELTLLRLVRSPAAGAVRAIRRRRAWSTPGPRPWRAVWRRPCVGASSSRTGGHAPSRST